MIAEQELIAKAEILIEQQMYNEAIVILERILNEINPNSIDALNDLCVIRILEKDYENALKTINSILELDPTNETAINNFHCIKEEIEELNEEMARDDNNISIIIPIFNRMELTLNCLNSLNEISTSVNFEVIIVDNASTDGSKEVIENLKSKLRYNLIYILNDKNYGFAKGNNIGAQAASYNYLLFLNNDIIAKEDFLSSSLSILKSKNVGIVGIKLLYPDSLIQHGGIAFNDRKRPEHIYKFYSGDYQLSDYVFPLQAVTGACMFIKKTLFRRLNGFEEKYVNGWEDMDLCFRVRKVGLNVYYNGSAKIFHLESQSENRLKYAAQNSELFYSRWNDSIISDLSDFYSIDKFRSINSFKSKFNLPRYLNIAIKIGVPSRKNQNWGDVYYAKALAKELKTLGHKTVIHYLNEWNQEDKNIDVVIHIKGLSEYRLKAYNFNIIWVINHPELHSMEELNSYDLVLVASRKYFEAIRSEISKPIYYLPQATDPEVFSKNENSPAKDIDLLFVGNNYEFKNNSVRKIISDIAALGQDYKLHIVGEHWEGFVDKKYIKAQFVEWDQLPDLYRRAKIVLNDHQKTMKENGFVNNRTYDIALTQSFQLSDEVEGLDEIGVVNYKDAVELKTKLDFYLNNAEAREEKAKEVYNKCTGYTFKERASFITNKIFEVCESKKVSTEKNDEEAQIESFPWGESDSSSMEVARNNYSLITQVNPQKINKNRDQFAITRIDITGSANNEFKNALYRSRPWEELQYKNSPTVCVLMTTFNRIDTITDSIQSVVSQTYKDWNLIIANDGGEDISEIIELFNDPRIKYFNLSHRGKPACLNYAIENSKSKYIAYLDDDDKYFPNHLEVLVTYLENHPSKSFVYSYSEEVKKYFYENQWVEFSRQPKYFYQADSKHFRIMNHIPNLCAVHKRDLFEKTGLYDEKLEVLIDWDMYRRLALASEPVFISICTAEYLRKINNSNSIEEQMTGMFYTNPVKYYKNRLRVLAKPFPSETFWPMVLTYYLSEKNINEFRFFIYKISHYRKTLRFDVAILVNIEINESVVELLKVAETRGALAIWNHKGLSKSQFIDEFIQNNRWENYILLDRTELFNDTNIEAVLNNKEKVLSLSESVAGKYYKASTQSGSRITCDAEVSIIIPTFNNWNYTERCLNSIFSNKLNKTNYEVVIIDNYSTDETRKKLEILQKKETRLKVILNEVNLGFAKANNIGAKAANGKYLLFLNNDTSVQGNYLDEMLECLLKNSAGIVGAKLLYEDKTIQHAGVVINDYPDPIMPFHIFKGKPNNYIPANMIRQYQAVTGACMFMEKEFFNQLNGFDESFINGYEDVDLCFRSNQKGKKVFYCPKSVIYHYESKTPGRFDNVEHNTNLLLSKWKGIIKKDLGELIGSPKVSIVIPVYNQLDYTQKCIESIIAYTNIPYEIIVVDNASTDGTDKYLSKLDHVKVVTNKINKGYPAAINQGLREAVGGYVVLLNNDIIATPNWLEGLIEVAESDEKIGLVGPGINIVSGLQVDHDARYKDVNGAVEYAKKIRNARRYAWMECPRIAFVCALIKRELLNQIGGLDERFSPGNYEDDDFCIRTMLAGYRIVIAWDVFIHHFGSKSFKANGTDLYNERLETNKSIFIDKWGHTPEEIMLFSRKPKNNVINIPFNKSDFQISFEEAKSFIENKKYPEALDSLNRAITLYEDENGQIKLEEIFDIAGNVCLAIESVEKAKEYFEKELEINNSSSAACCGLGQVFAVDENYEAAKAMFEWAVKNDPSNKHAEELLSRVNLELGLEEFHNSLT